MPGPTPERIAGRYRLERRIGAGGMAVVWLARDERLRRDVAVKFPSDVQITGRELRRRFEREARIAARINHPNLVPVYDYGFEGESPYLVMEYIDGETLATRLRRGPLSQSEVEDRARELLAALAAVHDEGFVHRDVKPSNILIDGRGLARMTDFGIARLTEGSEQLTQTGHVLGTARYMAPEVRHGQPATPRSDLYSLGVVLAECSPADAGRVCSLVRRLTAEEPSRRPRSAEEAAGMLVAAADPTSPDPAGETPTEATAATARLAPRASRGLIAVGALAAVLAGGAVALVLSSGGGGGPTGKHSEAAVRRAHRGTAEGALDEGTATRSTQNATAPSESATESPAETPTTAETGTTTEPPAEAEPKSVTPPPATAHAPKPGPATDPCNRFDEQKKALGEEQHLVDERYKEDPTTKQIEHERLDSENHTLDEQKAACEKGR